MGRVLGQSSSSSKWRRDNEFRGHHESAGQSRQRVADERAVGCAHHVTQRGNNRLDVFSVDEDRRVYLELLKEQAQKHALEILAKS